MKVSGIYKIVNKANGRYYIGSSYNIGWRTYCHFRKLKLGNHENPLLQNAWNKYGESLFEVVVVEHLPKEHLLIVEQKYLDIAKTDPKQSYNLNFIAGCGPGHKKGVKFSDEHIKNLSKSHIGQTAWNKGKTKKTNTSVCRMSITRTGKTYKTSKIYTFVNPRGIVVNFQNLKKHCEDNELNESTMNSLYHGKRGYKSHRGWKAFYV